MSLKRIASRWVLGGCLWLGACGRGEHGVNVQAESSGGPIGGPTGGTPITGGPIPVLPVSSGPAPSPGTPWTPESMWEAVGPSFANGDSGKMVTLAKDPTNPNVLLIGGDNGGPGIYRSSDGGASWVSSDVGLVTTSGHVIDSAVQEVWFVPNAPGVVLAAAQTGLYQSADHGQTWTNVCSYRQGTLDGTDLFAMRGSTIVAATPNGVLTSNDNGLTWRIELPLGVSNVVATASTLLVTGTDNSVRQWTGSGWAQWGLTRDNVHQLAVDPFNPEIVYASVAGGAYNYDLFASTDGGQDFTAVAYPPSLLGVQSLAFSPSYPDRLYLAGDEATVYLTADGNPAPTTTQIAPGDDVRHLYVEPNGAGDDRCWTADDQGIHVVESCSDPNATVVGLGAALRTNLVTGFAVSANGESIVAMLQDFPAVASVDGGQSWTALPAFEDGVAACSPVDPTRCYAFEGHSWWVSFGGVTTMRVRFSAQAPTFQGQVIAFDPANASHMFLVASRRTDGKIPIAVYESSDAGLSMTATGWPFSAAQLVAVDASAASHIIVDDLKQGLSVSTDGGQTWTRSLGAAGLSSRLVAIHPYDGHTVLLVGVNPSGDLEVLASSDGGLSFGSAPLYTVPQGTPMAIAFNDVTSGIPMVALATQGQGAFLSSDLGQTWTRLDLPPQLATHAFTSLQWQAGALYLGTYGQGIVRTLQPLQ